MINIYRYILSISNLYYTYYIISLFQRPWRLSWIYQKNAQTTKNARNGESNGAPAKHFLVPEILTRQAPPFVCKHTASPYESALWKFRTGPKVAMHRFPYANTLQIQIHTHTLLIIFAFIKSPYLFIYLTLSRFSGNEN